MTEAETAPRMTNSDGDTEERSTDLAGSESSDTDNGSVTKKTIISCSIPEREHTPPLNHTLSGFQLKFLRIFSLSPLGLRSLKGCYIVVGLTVTRQTTWTLNIVITWHHLRYRNLLPALIQFTHFDSFEIENFWRLSADWKTNLKIIKLFSVCPSKFYFCNQNIMNDIVGFDLGWVSFQLIELFLIDWLTFNCDIFKC